MSLLCSVLLCCVYYKLYMATNKSVSNLHRMLKAISITRLRSLFSLCLGLVFKAMLGSVIEIINLIDIFKPWKLRQADALCDGQNTSTTCSALISRSWYMFNKPSPDSLSVVMVLRRYVLTRLIVEKDLSGVDGCRYGHTKQDHHAQPDIWIRGLSCHSQCCLKVRKLSWGRFDPFSHPSLHSRRNVSSYHFKSGLYSTNISAALRQL